MKDLIFATEFAAELEAESASTIKCLERMKPELFGFKPHERSMEMGYLAQLTAEIPAWISYTLAHDYIDFATYPHIKAESAEQLVDHFKQSVAKSKDALMAIEEGALDEEFSLRRNGEILLTSSRGEQLKSMINHMVHHRGQLTVYMRLNDIAVPSIYGPSADDRSFKS